MTTPSAQVGVAGRDAKIDEVLVVLDALSKKLDLLDTRLTTHETGCAVRAEAEAAWRASVDTRLAQLVPAPVQASPERAQKPRTVARSVFGRYPPVFWALCLAGLALIALVSLVALGVDPGIAASAVKGITPGIAQ